MTKRLLFILLACVTIVPIMAQGGFYAEKDKNAIGPDLQANDQVFFNPDAKIEDVYHFNMEYRLEGGYVQHWQHSKNKDSRLYLHGGRIGMTFDFMLPYQFSIQTGLLYTITYGTTKQKWGVADEEESYAACDYMQHRITEHWLTIPIRAFYNIKLWKKMNLFFYAGPQLMIGLYEKDNIKNDMPPIITQYLKDQGIPTGTYNRFKDELYPVNIQLGIGGGLEWDCYRLQAGYDFGLNNQIKHPVADQHMWEWSWYVSFAYKLPIK